MISVILSIGNVLGSFRSPLAHIQSALLRGSVVLLLFFTPFSGTQNGLFQALTTSVCNTSTASSGAYTVTVCLTAPSAGSTLTGNTTVTAIITLSSVGASAVQRVVFFLSGAYLLTDYQSPYTFILPTAKWVDGNHNLAVEALMQDGFTTQRTTMTVSFNNGVTSPPVNNNHFQPTSGRSPTNGAPFLLAATGDAASGQVTPARVSDMITALNPNLFIYLGDVYEKGSPAEFYNWYGASSIYFGRLRSITDPTIGNHEYVDQATAPGYFDYWDNIPNYYSFNAGGWHIVSLNSNGQHAPTAQGSAQYNWLQQDLAAVPAGTCTLVFYHHPLFNIGAEGPATGMADIWKLMAQYNVDIVLNGHDHTYQRWVPLDGNGNPSANGITEFIAGAGGHSLQTFKRSDSRVAHSEAGSPGALLLQLNSASANFSYENTSGSILDSGVVSCAPAVHVFTLTVTSAHGTVSRNNPGPYHDGDVVQLTAIPNAGWSFANWSGDITGTSNPVSITMNGNKSVTANYTPVYTISGSAGVGGATITYTGGSTSSDINGNYSFSVPSGWSGAVTPSKAGYIFLPASRSYPSVVTNQTGQNFTAHALSSLAFRSGALKDGWTLESSETSDAGGKMNATNPTFNLGDNAANKQYRTILSFKTAGLPDTAVITSVKLKIRRVSVTGTNPFASLGSIVADIKQGAFDDNGALQIADFQAAASTTAALTITNAPVKRWYSGTLASSDFVYINKVGLTQFRLRFATDDNNNLIADYLSFYSGNYATAADKPALIITYYVP